LKIRQIVGAIRRVRLEADLELVLETHVSSSAWRRLAGRDVERANLARRFWTGSPATLDGTPETATGSTRVVNVVTRL
jgi:alpha-D-ribose 1-methylphosphonate 5-triphosphate synthase subunit PhnL